MSPVRAHRLRAPPATATLRPARAPRHPASLIILGRELGFEIASVETLHPFDDAAKLTLSDNHPDDLLRLVDRLNEILFGNQDLRLVMRKVVSR
ncbi:MAG: hypothetical protein KY432_04905 [Acidobacteria bacterium]|nr:hypothetical protein [Acidobacteriota bacterium]